MNKKIIFLPLVMPIFVCNLKANHTLEYEYLEIVPRNEWGANEEYTFFDSIYWQEIVEKKKKNQENKVLTPEEEEKIKENKRKEQEKLDYINKNFASYYTTTYKQTHEKERKLAWNIEKSDYVRSIVVHHTETENESDLQNLKQVFKFHSLSRGWGDIGYNFVIGKDGTIYEGRKGGDYTVGAHALWNNVGTVGIAMLGSYTKKGITKEQYQSLDKLVKHLSLKYGIDLSGKVFHQRECRKDFCVDTPLETLFNPVLVGHRDVGHTTCPGNLLYTQIQKVKDTNKDFSDAFIPVKRGEKNQNLAKGAELSENEKQKFLEKIANFSEIERKYYAVQLKKVLASDIYKGVEKEKIISFWRLLYAYDPKKNSTNSENFALNHKHIALSPLELEKRKNSCSGGMCSCGKCL